MGTDDINPFMGKNKEIPLWDSKCYNISSHFLRIKILKSINLQKD